MIPLASSFLLTADSGLFFSPCTAREPVRFSRVSSFDLRHYAFNIGIAFYNQNIWGFV